MEILRNLVPEERKTMKVPKRCFLRRAERCFGPGSVRTSRVAAGTPSPGSPLPLGDGGQAGLLDASSAPHSDGGKGAAEAPKARTERRRERSPAPGTVSVHLMPQGPRQISEGGKGSE